MNTKELFYLTMAALGGYAAWLAIKKHKEQQAASNWMTAGAFTGSNFDFYNNNSQADSITQLVGNLGKNIGFVG